MPATLIVLLLAVWTGAIAVFVSLDLPDKLLWMPALLALAGVFGSILPAAIAPNLALIANVATLTLFIFSHGELEAEATASGRFQKPPPLSECRILTN